MSNDGTGMLAVRKIAHGPILHAGLGTIEGDSVSGGGGGGGGGSGGIIGGGHVTSTHIHAIVTVGRSSG